MKKLVYESLADVLNPKTSADIINSLNLQEDVKQFLIDAGCVYKGHEYWSTPPTKLIEMKTKEGTDFYVHKETNLKELIQSFEFYHLEIPEKYK
jgi:hypothetical protein